MTLMKERLEEAFEAANNDSKAYIWKFPKNEEGIQEEIKLIDANPEQLQSFYNICHSMLHNVDKVNPGRYVLLEEIKKQRNKCNIELFLRKLESGSLCQDHRPYPRYVYLQDIRSCIEMNKEQFPSDKLSEIPISACTSGLPREFERIPIAEVIEGCLDQLGVLNTKPLTFSFILNMGIYFTADELKEFKESKVKDSQTLLGVVKEKLGLKPSVRLMVKPTGLNCSEFRAMLKLRPKKFSELTTEQLTILRNKALFKLENEVNFHINQWEDRIRQIRQVAKERNIPLK